VPLYGRGLIEAVDCIRDSRSLRLAGMPGNKKKLKFVLPRASSILKVTDVGWDSLNVEFREILDGQFPKIAGMGCCTCSRIHEKKRKKLGMLVRRSYPFVSL
jgi:hypothetical protein